MTVFGAQLSRLASNLISSDGLSYYSRENCIARGFMPDWQAPSYAGATHFEDLFKSPLNVDLLAAAHSGQESGFEQVTADWGCKFDATYGSGKNAIGFFGPGAKDPAGGGCPRGPVKVYEDLVCAIRLGLRDDETAFKDFCSADVSTEDGMFECLAFFANVLTETGSFAETEERDPRPYCWNREDGNAECCPAADHRPCMKDSDKQLSSEDYPADNNKWLTDAEVSGKCCSYHGRGFLQVSYEPNYKALSQAMTGDEKTLWHHPYKLRSDGVMGWTSALWFWFNKHPAAVSDGSKPAAEVSPRAEVLNWREGRGLPGAIAVINGMECAGNADSPKARQRATLLFTIARRLEAAPPTEPGERKLPYYPLPGTQECENNKWCRVQFHNDSSVCSVFRQNFSCVVNKPYVQNTSTPMGWNRRLIKLSSQSDAQPLCVFGRTREETPEVWENLPFNPQLEEREWYKMLDVHVNNVCDYVKQKYVSENETTVHKGDSEVCSRVCWKDFADDKSLHGQPCETPENPCLTFSEYVSHPMPAKNFETGEMGEYFGGVYLGRVGPGLVHAMNTRAFGDRADSLCYWFGGTACHWTISIGTRPEPAKDVHGCRVYPPGVDERTIVDSLKQEKLSWQLSGKHERPPKLEEVLRYYDAKNCSGLDYSDTVLAKVLPEKDRALDFLIAGQYTPADGFDNLRWDEFDNVSVNENSIQYGDKGALRMWETMMCAYHLGVPDDPEIFKRELFRREAKQGAELSEDELDFAKLEFASLLANVIKETGALGQAEEQDPRAYCNWQGGSNDKCCENYWGNNPPCADRGGISEESRKEGMTPEATCCSYHGRGFLQTSYEKNYGNLGSHMLASEKMLISPAAGRKLLVNYPQVIDPFGVTGWTAAFLFWLKPNPCQYCDGKNANTLDWNAKQYSPHDAMVRYETPGEGFGKVVNIINGMECEASVTTASPRSLHGAQMRLAFLYNLAQRLQIRAPGEHTILPLPGTKECDESAWCRGTFSPKEKAPFGRTSGGCWALTPQRKTNAAETWTYCKPGSSKFMINSKYGAHFKTPSFTMRKERGCTALNEFKCGSRDILMREKPSMTTDQDLKNYLAQIERPSEYDDTNFEKLRNMSLEQICSHAYDTTGRPAVNGQSCRWWCMQSSGGGSCKQMDPTTCEINRSGVGFVRCVSKFFKTVPATEHCVIDIQHTPEKEEKPDMNIGCQQSNCSKCVSAADKEYENEHCAGCVFGKKGNSWPCATNMCKCVAFGEEPHSESCSEDCAKCVSTSGNSWDDDNCTKCAKGANPSEWPCNREDFCKCAAA